MATILNTMMQDWHFHGNGAGIAQVTVTACVRVTDNGAKAVIEQGWKCSAKEIRDTFADRMKRATKPRAKT